jgi:hypothetical protein
LIDWTDPQTRSAFNQYALNLSVPGYALYGCIRNGCGGLGWAGAALGVLPAAGAVSGVVREARVAGAVCEAADFSAIGSTGQIGEKYLKSLGGQSQVFFQTSQGARYVDQFVDGVAHESKVGYTSLTSSVQAQIAKDTELLNSGAYDAANWHFFMSPVTGLGGPSQPLFNALQHSNITVVIH